MEGNKKITIVTHDGNFHTDDIFAVATLSLVLGEENVSVVRSRGMDVIGKGDYVVDVGGVYDQSKNRFDHHQEGGAGVRKNTIPYASFGLVWKEYGGQLCGNSEIAEKIDQILVQPIDMIDNGIQFIETKVPNLYPYDIGDFFDSFKPTWKETTLNIDDVFIEAVSLAKSLLVREIIRHKDKLESDTVVEKVYKESKDKRLIVLDRFYPSNEFLSQFPEPLFIIFPKEDGNWVVNTIRNDKNSFVNRKDLPENWAGKRDEELEKITGISGAVFCHKGRFTAVAKTKEAILKLAEIALNS